jgi:hypothetical protein
VSTNWSVVKAAAVGQANCLSKLARGYQYHVTLPSHFGNKRLHEKYLGRRGKINPYFHVFANPFDRSPIPQLRRDGIVES